MIPIMRRIGIDARMYGPQVTGIGNYVQYLGQELVRGNRDDELVFFLPPANAQTFPGVGPRVSVVPVTVPWYSWSEQIIWPAVLARQRCDLVWFPNFNVPILFRNKFVVTIHDLTPLQFPGPNQVRSKIRRAAYRAVLRFALRQAAAIIAVSKHTQREVAEHEPSCAGKIIVIYPGLSPVFQKLPVYGTINQTLDTYGIQQPYLLYSGVWRDHKNLPGLLEAFRILKDKRKTPLQLVLSGDQRNQDPKIAPVLRTFAPHEVIATGFITDVELADLYRGAQVTVIPSFREGFGLTAIESLACGTPVAASRTTSIPEVLGAAGQYFSPDQPLEMAHVIERLIAAPARAQAVRDGARLVQQYQWSVAAKRMMAVFANVVK